MRKLFSILSVITLVGTTSPNVVSCINENTEDNEEDIFSEDIETANEITAKVVAEINQAMQSRLYVDSGRNKLEGLYKKVDIDNITAKLDLSKDKVLANYFITDFSNMFENVNNTIWNMYSNHFSTKMPLSFNKDKSEIEVSFINVDGLKKNFPVGIKSESFRGVRVNLKERINFQYKSVSSSFDVSVVYDVTENTTVLKELSSKATKSLMEKLKEYFQQLKNVDFSTNNIFKSLYEEMQWDFSSDIKSLDNALKNSLKNFIINNEKFAEMNISYNDVALLEQVVKGELNSENKGTANFDDVKSPRELTLSNWFKDTVEPKSINDVTANDFVSFYKNNIGEGLNLSDNTPLSLGSFRINLSYLNINGMGLSGYAQDIEDNNVGVDIEMNLNLSRAAIDQKLSNWGKIIIAFWKWIKTGSFAKKTGLEIKVSSSLFATLNSANDGRKGTKKGLSVVANELVKEFKKTNEAKELADLKLFNIFATETTTKLKKESIDGKWSSVLEWNSSNSKPWEILFTFGKSFKSGLYYCFASSSKTKNNSIDFKIILNTTPY